MFDVSGRAMILALSILVGGIGAALAHALPGSTLTISQTEKQLNLSISLSLEDLIIASPALKFLENASADQALSTASLKRLSGYFADHLVLQRADAALPLQIVRASVQLAQNEHVGIFKVLIVELTTSLAASGKALSLTMTYDAVMHEVRSHRATVYWAQPDTNPSKIADFGFRKNAGKTQPISLQHPVLSPKQP